MKQHKIKRRTFLGATAISAGYFWGGSGEARASTSALEKLNLAVIGIGGRGSANLGGVSKENIVALCDVDDVRAGKAYDRYSKARKFFDYRELFDKLGDQIDGAVISTPDHTHFHIAHRALSEGKHVYLEKPMAHNVWECRELTNLAREKKLATQLGVQRHTIPNMHRVVELIQSGAIGNVKEVHCWVGSDRGMPKLDKKIHQSPTTLKYDLWLGPAKRRAKYHPSVTPYGWRFWWDYGTGETGNWGCHILDIPFWALDLKYPTKVGAKGDTANPLMTPKQMESWMEFPANEKRPGVKLFWAQAKKGPDILRKKGLSPNGNNTLFIGEKGMLLCGFSKRQLLPEDQFADYQAPEPFVPNSPGFHKEWTDSCKGGQAASCHFGYSGPMAETVLLGNVAYRALSEFDWDAENLKAGSAIAQRLIKEDYAKGWEV
ncbi:MAG: Gfo/Idh/MocA family oxidoreductase [Planctomycetota bacterium]|nr:Gfo/Idh/MocA family oxidoreductase [Planctomycetota bacterium]